MSQSGTLYCQLLQQNDGMCASAGPDYQVRLSRFLVRSKVEPLGYPDRFIKMGSRVKQRQSEMITQVVAKHSTASLSIILEACKMQDCLFQVFK